MKPMRAAVLAAVRLAHEALAEWRMLEGTRPVAPAVAQGEVSTTSARIESAWQRNHQAPATARAGQRTVVPAGFRLPSRAEPPPAP